MKSTEYWVIFITTVIMIVLTSHLPAYYLIAAFIAPALCLAMNAIGAIDWEEEKGKLLPRFGTLHNIFITIISVFAIYSQRGV